MDLPGERWNKEGGFRMREQEDLSKRQEQLSAKLKKFSPVKQTLLEKWLRGSVTSAARPEQLPPIERVTRAQELPLSFFQEHEIQRLFPPAQNEVSALSACVRLKGSIDHGVLEQSLNALAARHEVLRTTFQQIKKQHVQVITPTLTVKLPVIKIDLPQAERLPEALRLVSQEAHRPYDLAHEPLWRALLLRLEADDHVMLLTMDHFISDA